jgi:hypothetical protein
MAHNLVAVFEFTGNSEDYDLLREFLQKFGKAVQLQQAAWFLRCHWDLKTAMTEIQQRLKPDDHVYLFDAANILAFTDEDTRLGLARNFHPSHECFICGDIRTNVSTPD